MIQIRGNYTPYIHSANAHVFYFYEGRETYMFNVHDTYTKGSSYVIYHQKHNYAYVEIQKVNDESRSTFMQMLYGKKWYLETYDVNALPSRNEYLLVQTYDTFTAYKIIAEMKSAYTKYVQIKCGNSIRDTIIEVFKYSWLDDAYGIEFRMIANELETIILATEEHVDDYFGRCRR